MLLTMLAAQEDYFKVWGHVFLKDQVQYCYNTQGKEKQHSFLVNRFTTIQ